MNSAKQLLPIDGDRFVNAPEHRAGLWTRYDFPSIDAAIAFGADYVSE